MVLQQFPDLRWLKAQAEARFANRQGVAGRRLETDGWPNVILNATTRETVRDNILGPLSIFTNLSGTSELQVEKKRVTVSPETFFVSNSGQSYTLEVHEKEPTEIFNIHFGERFIEKALPSIFSTADQLLDNKIDGKPKDFGFYNRLVPQAEEFKAIVRSIHQHGNNDLFLEEQLFQLLHVLLGEQQKVKAMRERLVAVKSSTRDEILCRLFSTADYLHTFYYMNPSLDELAAISCLSKFHFLRLFKLAFGQTPHQYLTTLRIKRASESLRNSSDGIAAIAYSLGFESSSTFSRLFYNQTGCYPSQFRSNS